MEKLLLLLMLLLSLLLLAENGRHGHDRGGYGRGHGRGCLDREGRESIGGGCGRGFGGVAVCDGGGLEYNQGSVSSGFVGVVDEVVRGSTPIDPPQEDPPDLIPEVVGGSLA